MPRFVDVNGLMEYLNEKAEEMKGSKFNKWVLLKMLEKIGSFIDEESIDGWMAYAEWGDTYKLRKKILNNTRFLDIERF